MTKDQTPSREDIIRMAREAGLPSDELYHPNLERFAALIASRVAAAAIHNDLLWQAETETAVLGEREACAKLCELNQWSASGCAAAIRARKENT